MITYLWLLSMGTIGKAPSSSLHARVLVPSRIVTLGKIVKYAKNEQPIARMVQFAATPDGVGQMKTVHIGFTGKV
jgi:hypothetical protein